MKIFFLIKSIKPNYQPSKQNINLSKVSKDLILHEKLYSTLGQGFLKFMALRGSYILEYGGVIDIKIYI